MANQIKIALFSPASLPLKEDFEKAIEVLRNKKLGFKNFCDFKETPPGIKAFLLYELFTNKEFTHIWAIRGGFGSLKLLPFLEELFSNQKISPYELPVLIGYSDISVLHAYLFFKFGKCGFHAPVLVELPHLSSSMLQHLFKTIFEGEKIYLKGKAFRSGEAEGILICGNLVSLASLCGTPYFNPEVLKSGVILLLEEVNEKPYRMERALLQLIFSLNKKSIKALLFGNLGISEVEKLIYSLIPFLPEEIPIGYGFKIGHSSENYPLIFGRKAVVKTRGETLELFQENLLI